MFTSRLGPVSSYKPVVSVIIPTLNEAKNLPLVLPYIPVDVVDEVILVDGRSKDHTVEIARQLLPSIKIVLESKSGKGAALRRGYAESTGDILVVIDADGSHDPREIPRFVTAILEGADFAKGSRFAPSGGTTDMPRLRKMGNWALTSIVNLLFSQSFTDLCYGFHAFRRHCLDYLDLDAVDGFEVDTAIYLQAVRSNLKVVDVPSFEGLRFYGKGKLKTFPDGWRVLRTIFREWSAHNRLPARVQPIGFRSSYSIRVGSSQSILPTPESLPIYDGQPTSRERYTLEEFFNIYLTDAPKEETNPLLSEVLLDVMERFGASSGGLMILKDELHQYNSFQVFGRKIELVQIHGKDELLQKGIAAWAVQNRQSVLIADTKNDERWLCQDWEQEEDISRSALVVPFFLDQNTVGVLLLTRPIDRAFTEADLDRIHHIEIFL